MNHATRYLSLVLGASLCIACGGDDDEAEDKGCSLEAQSGCEAGQVCEEVQGGEPACFAPVAVEGRVFDQTTESGVEGARVVARDANDAAVSAVAVSDAMGAYELNVPVPRNADGTPLRTEYTLRADAAGYVTYPTAPRVAIPVDVSTPVDGVVQSTATDIGLIPLADTLDLGTISGKVLIDEPRGTLVVAGGSTGIADRDGDYTVFNVPAGEQLVTGFKQGVNLTSETASVAAGAIAGGVDLELDAAATAVVSGQIQMVNPGMGDATSVILVVEDTFVANSARGESPPGLRAVNVAGAFTVEGVPAGRYVVLAAFENDFMVRDPDTTIGGTDIVHIEVANADFAIPEGFKVTGALDIISPDAEMEVSGTPTFMWVDDSSEKSYDLIVFDAFGNEVWSQTGLPSVSGGGEVSVAYGGMPLTSGHIYQFRATSVAGDGVPISRTEDLRGVFLYR